MLISLGLVGLRSGYVCCVYLDWNGSDCIGLGWVERFGFGLGLRLLCVVEPGYSPAAVGPGWVAWVGLG